MSEQVISSLRVGNIQPGLNPRSYFDPAEMEELEQSIKSKGVIQPILVRAVNDGFQIVFGERRWRAATKIFGADYLIPVMVKELTDQETLELATIENIERANMSPTEEAVAAAKILGFCNGNRDEAAKRLGWSRTTLDKRLALTHCTEKVQNALNERKIQLGHAELLAVAQPDRQDKALAKLLSTATLPPVAAFKAQLESISKPLATAIFNKDECAGCIHNSGNQQALFGEAIHDGHCTNGVCYDKKTVGALEIQKVALSETYPRVEIIRSGEEFTFIKLIADGAGGVGKEQANACRACKNFGACISAKPGHLGSVEDTVCFDLDCNMEKVGIRALADKKAAEKKALKADAQKTGKPEENADATKVEPLATVQASNRAVDYRNKVWRKVLKKELFADTSKNLSLLIGVMMTHGGYHVSQNKMSEAFQKLTGGSVPTTTGRSSKAALLVEAATDEVRGKMLSGIVISMIDHIDNSELPGMLAFVNADMANHWKLNSEYLELLTKSEIAVAAKELGLDQQFGEDFAKVLNGKKDELIGHLLTIKDFDYTGKIPSLLQYAK